MSMLFLHTLTGARSAFDMLCLISDPPIAATAGVELRTIDQAADRFRPISDSSSPRKSLDTFHVGLDEEPLS
jgi:hypothetical protein